MFLKSSDFRSLVANAPLFSIDFLITHNGKVLLGKRLNRPAKGAWFVPGGRVRKDERFVEAVRRISMEELGAGLELSGGETIGVYEHFYKDSIFGHELSTHYIAHGIRYDKAVDLSLIPKDQHSSLDWWSIAHALQSGEVHDYTKDYLTIL